MKIGYVTFGKDDFGYGLSYILHKNGIEAKRATVKTARHFDVVLFSIFWWAHVYRFVSFCAKSGIGGKAQRPRVIVGGFNTFNPWVFLPWAHQVVVGDGENVVKAAIAGEAHPSIFTGREKRVTYAHAEIGENDFVYAHTDISRIEIARGCKYKCPFCQLTYLKPYREAALEPVLRAIGRVETKRVALFAPNGISHSHYKEIAAAAREKELANVASDVRYNELAEFDNNNTARMGLEGISYRLRKSVTKIISNEGFIELIKERSAQCRAAGLTPSLHTYFILDLPTEGSADWEEFYELLEMVNEMEGARDLTWIITGNVFMPGPHTPFEDKEVHLDRDYSAIWKRALSDRRRKAPFNFTLTGRHSVFSPYSRLLSMIATRGGEDAGEIIYNITSNDKLRRALIGPWPRSLKVLSRFLRHYGGVERFTGIPAERPWKVVEIPKE